MAFDVTVRGEMSGSVCWMHNLSASVISSYSNDTSLSSRFVFKSVLFCCAVPFFKTFVSFSEWLVQHLIVNQEAMMTLVSAVWNLSTTGIFPLKSALKRGRNNGVAFRWVAALAVCDAPAIVLNILRSTAFGRVLQHIGRLHWSKDLSAVIHQVLFSSHSSVNPLLR